MAAGTAVSLVPIRSITRRIDAAPNAKSLSAVVGTHDKLSVVGDAEIVQYIPDSQPGAGPIREKLVKQLQGIQLGKVEDSLGWRHLVREEDTKTATVEA